MVSPSYASVTSKVHVIGFLIVSYFTEFVRKAAEKAMNKKTGECQTSDGSADNMDESGGADSEKSNSDHN